MDTSIIISVDSSKILFENFISELANYPKIKNYEILFVNDSENAIFDTTLLQRYNIEFAKIIYPEHKMGYGAANNLVAEKASGEFLVFMNDDVVLMNNCLEILISDLNDNHFAAVQPKLIYPQSNLVQSTGHIFTNYSNSHAFENANRNADIVNTSGWRTALTTAVCATRKDLFIKMGMFDTIYYNAWEGMEYTLKLTLNGFGCWYESKAEAYHIRGGARGAYSLNEEAQAAIFWSRWSSKIPNDLCKYITLQLNSYDIEDDYLLLNFSKIPDISFLQKNCNLYYRNSINYTYFSGMKHIDFIRQIPLSIIKSKSPIIYLVNNFKDIQGNMFWLEHRIKSFHKDIVIDLSGNVMYAHQLLPNSRV